MKKILFFVIKPFSSRNKKLELEGEFIFTKEITEAPSAGTRICPFSKIVGIVQYHEWFFESNVINIPVLCEMNPIDLSLESQHKIIKRDMEQRGWKFVSNSLRARKSGGF